MVTFIDCPSCHATISDDREKCPNCSAEVQTTRQSFELLAARIGVLNFQLALELGHESMSQESAVQAREEITRLEEQIAKVKEDKKKSAASGVS